MRKVVFLTAALLMLLMIPGETYAQQHEDTEQLGKALDYFNSEKYHEALIIFHRLDNKYKLNPRFRAYIGLCYYYEWDYKKATEYFDVMIPQLEALSPHERNVYYYANGESHFNLQQYEQAIPMYEKTLTVCYENEKGDALYRLGFCYMFLQQWANARDYFRAADRYYRRYRNTNDLQSRLTQIEKMTEGCERNMKESDLYKEPLEALTDNALNRDSSTLSTVHVSIDETQRHQVIDRVDHIHSFSSIQKNTHRALIAILNFQYNLTTGATWRNRFSQKSILIPCSYSQGCYSLLWILSLCGKDSGTLGTQP